MTLNDIARELGATRWYHFLYFYLCFCAGWMYGAVYRLWHWRNEDKELDKVLASLDNIDITAPDKMYAVFDYQTDSVLSHPFDDWDMAEAYIMESGLWDENVECYVSECKPNKDWEGGYEPCE